MGRPRPISRRTSCACTTRLILSRPAPRRQRLQRRSLLLRLRLPLRQRSPLRNASAVKKWIGPPGAALAPPLFFLQWPSRLVRLPVLLLNLPQLAFEAMADYTLEA